MNGEAFAFFRWVSYWDTRMGQENEGHGWECEPCRDGWQQIIAGYYSTAKP